MPCPRTSLPRRLKVRRQNGVTLVELLVVLVLMGIAAALVAPAVRSPRPLAESIAGAPLSPVDGVINAARRLAIGRGQPLALRIANDGVWSVVAADTGDPVDAGRVSGALAWLPTLRIDALGRCTLRAGALPPDGRRTWDPLACRWRG